MKKVLALFISLILFSCDDSTGPAEVETGWVFQESNTTYTIYNCFFSDADHGWAIMRDTLLRTKDGGKNWEKKYYETRYQEDHFDLFFIDSLNGWATYLKDDIICTSSIGITNDGGDNWQEIVIDNNGVIKFLHFRDRNFGYAISEEIQWENGEYFSKIYISQDGGYTWTLSEIEGMQPMIDAFNSFDDDSISVFSSLAFISDEIGFATGYEYFEHQRPNGSYSYDSSVALLYKTTDSGANWQKVNSGAGGSKIFFVNENTGWIVDGKDIYKTMNGGYNWDKIYSNDRKVTKIFFADEMNGWLLNSSYDKVEAYISYDNVFMKTVDGGYSWHKMNFATGYSANGLIHYNDFHFIDENTGWAVGDEGKIIHTDNGGNVVE